MCPKCCFRGRYHITAPDGARLCPRMTGVVVEYDVLSRRGLLLVRGKMRTVELWFEAGPELGLIPLELGQPVSFMLDWPAAKADGVRLEGRKTSPPLHVVSTKSDQRPPQRSAWDPEGPAHRRQAPNTAYWNRARRSTR